MSNQANQPAFPIATSMAETRTGNQTDFYIEGGLTKREYFAAMAMQGLLSFCGLSDGAEESARCAAKAADALLAELDKERDS